MYNYEYAVKNDIKEYIEENKEYLDDMSYDTLFDAMWVADSVTGNASGSYTFNTCKAEENLAGNWSLLKDALYDFGCTDISILDNGPEWCDVTIRCYLLSSCLSEVLKELGYDD